MVVLRQQPASEQHRTIWRCPPTSTRWSQLPRPAPRVGVWLEAHADSATRMRAMARMRSTVSQALRALPTAASVPCGGALLPYPSEPLRCYCAVAVTAERPISRP
jgi:hypothetical protein